MTDEQTANHLRAWCAHPAPGRHPAYGWPTDACGYDQHIRFVDHRNNNWQGGDPTEWRAFVRAYADALHPAPTPIGGIATPVQDRPVDYTAPAIEGLDDVEGL